MTTPPSLVEFLLARIDERLAEAQAEAVALRDAPRRGGKTTAQRRWLEASSLRRVVERLSAPDPHAADEDCPDCDVLYLLAAPYSDHSDFDPSWS